MGKDYSSNDMRSMAMNPNSSHYDAAMNNHSNQLNSNNSAYWSSREYNINNYGEYDSSIDYAENTIKPKIKEVISQIQNNESNISIKELENAIKSGYCNKDQLDILKNQIQIEEKKEIEKIRVIYDDIINSKRSFWFNQNEIELIENYLGKFDIADKEIINYFLDKKINLEKVLDSAAISKNWLVVEYLFVLMLTNKLDSTYYNKNFEQAIKYGYFEVVQIMVNNNVKITSSSLSTACFALKTDILKFLITKCDNNLIQEQGDLLIQYVIYKGDLDLLKLIINSGINITKYIASFKNLKNNGKDIIYYLFEIYDKNFFKEYGYYLLYYPIELGDLELLKELVLKGTVVSKLTDCFNKLNINGKEIAKFLFEQGAVIYKEVDKKLVVDKTLTNLMKVLFLQ